MILFPYNPGSLLLSGKHKSITTYVAQFLIDPDQNNSGADEVSHSSLDGGNVQYMLP